MQLRSVEITDFRNLAAMSLSFARGPVIIWGENGQGKSNLLEAMVLGCTGTLQRAAKEEEAIGWGKEIARVKVEITRLNEESLRTEIALARNAKSLLKINDISRRRSDLLGLIPVIAFGAEDLQIIKGDPSRRRQFLNNELSQLSRSYHWNLMHYARSLEQRNRLLKELREARRAAEQLLPWEEALARYGAKLIERRGAFLSQLQLAAQTQLQRLSPGWGALQLVYRPAWGVANHDAPFAELAAKTAHQLEALLLERYRQNRGEEIARGFSLVGPHRDDFDLLLGEVDQRIFGSQGQQRSLAIALRLGLADMLQEAAGEAPILLLDDVFSELDQERRRGLFEALGPARQFFLTAPAKEEVPEELLTGGQVFRMRQGRIEQVDHG